MKTLFKKDSERELDKPKTFTYIQVPEEPKHLFCLQQNPIELAVVLFFKKNSLSPIVRPNPEELGARVVLRELRSSLGLFRRNVRFFVAFFYYKNKFRKGNGFVKLPCYGQICVPVHKGNKVFNFLRGMVTKIFDHDVSPSVVVGEIELLKLISQFDFAPSLGRWNIEEGWYEEEYIRGSLDSSWKPLDSNTLLEKFQCEVIQHLKALVLFQVPIARNSLEYVTEIAENLPFSQLAKRESTREEFRQIATFIEYLIERIRKEGDCPIFLTFAHGDFVPANMLNTRNGIKIIDWEGAGNRSALYDFFSYFFYRPVSREVPIGTLIPEIDKALPMFLSRLALNTAELSDNLMHLEDIYRWIFYIEMLCRLVKREMTDNQLDILDYILRSISAFDMYEKAKKNFIPK